MPGGFADDAARAAIRDAVRAIEDCSAAEVVVAVRRQSSPWTAAHLIVGVLAAIAAHAYMLFAPTPFSTTALFTGPILAGGLLGAASTLILPLPRWLVPASRRRRVVAARARATFVERGIRRTRGATGVLVYVSVAERMAEVVADDGVVAAVDERDWRPLVAAIDDAARQGGVAVGAAIARLAPVLAAALPRGADDVNELADDLHVHEERH